MKQKSRRNAAYGLTQATLLTQSPVPPTQGTAPVGNQETDLADMHTEQSYRSNLLTESPSPQVCLGLCHTDSWDNLGSLPSWYLHSTEIHRNNEQVHVKNT